MFQFSRFASYTYVFSIWYLKRGGFPHSEIHGSKLIRSSPWLIAAYHVLHRLCAPRHPLNALWLLDYSHLQYLLTHPFYDAIVKYHSAHLLDIDEHKSCQKNWLFFPVDHKTQKITNEHKAQTINCYIKQSKKRPNNIIYQDNPKKLKLTNDNLLANPKIHRVWCVLTQLLKHTIKKIVKW